MPTYAPRANSTAARERTFVTMIHVSFLSKDVHLMKPSVKLLFDYISHYKHVFIAMKFQEEALKFDCD